MNRQKWNVVVAVLVVIGVSALFLSVFKARQQLGKPGLKLAQQAIFDDGGGKVSDVSIELPETVLDYRSAAMKVSTNETAYLPKDTTYGMRRYLREDRSFVDVRVVMMGTDRTSIHQPQICLDGQGWKITKSEILNLPVDKPHAYDLPVMKLTASKSFKMADGNNRLYTALYVYWFVSEKRLTADHRERMLAMVTDVLTTGVMPRWAYVSCLSVCEPGFEEATFERMKQFITAAVPEFQIPTRPGRSSPPPMTAPMR